MGSIACYLVPLESVPCARSNGSLTARLPNRCVSAARRQKRLLTHMTTLLDMYLGDLKMQRMNRKKMHALPVRMRYTTRFVAKPARFVLFEAWVKHML